MAAYSLTNYETNAFKNIDDALAALVTKINTVTNTKTIRYIDVLPEGDLWYGVIIYDT